MATIVTRAGKGSPLTHDEVDANFNNLNSDKYEAGDSPSFAGLTVDTDTLYVDSTNNRVGIGTSSPSYTLDVENNSVRFGTVDTGYVQFAKSAAASDNWHIGAEGDGTFRFFNGNYGSGSERMRIDSSGNLLVGTTNANPATNNVNGFATVGNITEMSRSAGEVLRINRGNDGDIVSFKSDGTTVGSIGVSSGDLVIDGNNVVFADNGNQRLSVGNVALFPINDNSYDLGFSSGRFDDIYATNGTIQTSDRNEKQDIEALSDAEQRVAVAAKGLLRKYRWKDAVAEKGDAARIHFGIIAQDLQAAFEAEGLDAGRYGMFIRSTWWEATESYTDDEGVEQTRTNTYETQEEAPEGATERTRMGVRYPELLAFIIAAL